MKSPSLKKVAVIGVVSILLLMIPILSAIAELSQKGDPEIVVISSKLCIPDEILNLPGNSTVPDSVYYLYVQIKSTKHATPYTNGTLSVNEKIKDYGARSFLKPNRNFTISSNFTVWTDLTPSEVKESEQPFIIYGLNEIPKGLTCNLELVTVNPKDNNIYSYSVELDIEEIMSTSFTKSDLFTIKVSSLTEPTSMTTKELPPTQISITSVSSPSDKYKGYTVPLYVTVKNIGLYSTSGYVTIYVDVKSVEAGTTSNPYTNDDGPIILQDMKTFTDTLAPGQSETYTFNIDYKDYQNGAMNVGKWEIDFVKVTIGSVSDTESNPCSDPLFKVKARTIDQELHPIFIYYMWNSGGASDNWEGTNPRNYFTNGNGLVKAGLWRFETYDSNIPIRFKMHICYDDDSWDLSSNITETENMRLSGKCHFGNQVNTIFWYQPPCNNGENFLSPYNCGFDILLMAAARNADHAGQCFGNLIVVCKSGASTFGVDWKYNIDGVVQHEFAHVFQCQDRPDHPNQKCIMVYNWYVQYLFEISLCPFDRPTNNWCTDGDCADFFNQNWAGFYDVYLPPSP